MTFSSTRATSAHAAHVRELGNIEKGARGATGAFTGLGKAMMFASNAFISGVVIGATLKKIYDDTKKLEEAQNQLGNAVKNAGGNWAAMQGQVEGNIKALAKLSDFTRGDLTTGMGQLFAATKNITTAEK